MSFLLLCLYAWLTSAQGTPSADALARRATREGTPLVDAVGSDPRYAQVTFIWRGTSDTRNVAVVGTFLKAPLVPMTRIGKSDVWYTTATVPASARFTYWIAENSPMITEGEGPQLAAQLAALQADPPQSPPDLRVWCAAERLQVHCGVARCEATAVDRPRPVGRGWDNRNVHVAQRTAEERANPRGLHAVGIPEGWTTECAARRV